MLLSLLLFVRVLTTEGRRMLLDVLTLPFLAAYLTQVNITVDLYVMIVHLYHLKATSLLIQLVW